MDDFKLVPIHKHPEYLQDCCALINSEWKRSETARMRSLLSSCDNLPTSLVLLQKNQVIGHAKLSAIPSIKDACFVESVVISTSLRGNGYGRILMNRCEEYCKQLHLDVIYLSTKGQKQFYHKLGYIECQPISIYGSYIVPTNCILAPKQKLAAFYENAPPPPPLPAASTQSNANSTTFMRKSINL